MAIKVTDSGRNNAVMIQRDSAARSNGSIVIEGENNRLSIASSVHAEHLQVQLLGGSSLLIDEGCILKHLFVHASMRGSVTIGARCALGNGVRLLLHEPGNVTIGAGSMIAHGVDITISDMHSIVDLTTGARVNPARDVHIGDHVWIGQNATILKGVSIGSGAIIGASAVVMRDIPENCVAIGNPARVVRQGVTWRPDLI